MRFFYVKTFVKKLFKINKHYENGIMIYVKEVV